MGMSRQVARDRRLFVQSIFKKDIDASYKQVEKRLMRKFGVGMGKSMVSSIRVALKTARIQSAPRQVSDALKSGTVPGNVQACITKVQEMLQDIGIEELTLTPSNWEVGMRKTYRGTL